MPPSKDNSGSLPDTPPSFCPASPTTAEDVWINIHPSDTTGPQAQQTMSSSHLPVPSPSPAHSTQDSFTWKTLLIVCDERDELGFRGDSAAITIRAADLAWASSLRARVLATLERMVPLADQPDRTRARLDEGLELEIYIAWGICNHRGGFGLRSKEKTILYRDGPDAEDEEDEASFMRENEGMAASRIVEKVELTASWLMENVELAASRFGDAVLVARIVPPIHDVFDDFDD